MNRNCYRLVFNATLGMMVPVAETARRSGKAGSGSAASGAVMALAGALLSGVMGTGSVHAELPVASAKFAAPGTTANYRASGAQAYMNQVGNKAIVNFDRFNVSAGHDVQFRQVDGLATQNLVPGANFSSLVRIHDINPSIIAGSLSQAAGQRASVTLVNSNGIAFMGGSQVNLGSFTASTLNMQDGFLDNFLPGADAAQFENALDGSAAHGFIKVFEGAQITAASQGRVMLVAPTVVNHGRVSAADGQVIAAAGSKVYLRSAGVEDPNVRGLLVEVDSPAGLAGFDTANADVRAGELDGQAVNLANPAEDRLGHVSNLGELSTPRGNVTMVGYAVNQQGIARATTSVIANGSVYLLAKDTKTGSIKAGNIGSARAGRVLLDENSLTEVLPEVSDNTAGLDGEAGKGLEKASQVRVLGQDIRMAGSAAIIAPAAEVRFEAVDDPSLLRASSSPFTLSGAPASDTARIHLASGARISVAGLDKVQVSAARNAVEVELRGDELKDSPVNQQGPLRGEKVYVDISRALANADSGMSTLIARDSLDSYQARLERNVAERSTLGGRVDLVSQGETLLENGVVIDLSGGSVQYTAANVKNTVLSANGKLVDLADASAETRYDGIATRFVKDYGRWNVKKVFDLGQGYHYDPGYLEGQDAGVLNVIGMKAVVMQADVQGRTTVGERQQYAGGAPVGAQLNIGTNGISGGARNDYKLNQRVEVSSTGANLAGLKFGEALAAELKETLTLDPALMGEDKVQKLGIFSNQAAVVRDALRAPLGGSVQIAAQDLNVLADIEASGGVIDLAARNNAAGVPQAVPVLQVAEGVTLSARGNWTNELPGGAGAVAQQAPMVNGGKVSLAAEVSLVSGVYEAQGEVRLGQDARIDVNGGGRVQKNGKVIAGKGGDVTVAAYAVTGVDRNLAGFATGKGGTVSLGSHRIQVGGTPDVTPGTLNLDAGFFQRGGFADYRLTALDTLNVAENTRITPVAVSLELQPDYLKQASGSRVDDFTRQVTRDEQTRQAASLTLVAAQKEAGTGDIVIARGARIETDPKASITLQARNSIDIEGELVAHGGAIRATLDRSSGTVTDSINRNPLWLGEQSLLDVSGVARTYTDSKGRLQGEVLAGGTVRLDAVTGYVVSAAGSRVDVSGAAPVRLDVPNEAGGLGRWVGSDAGAVSVFAEEGMLLDGALAAHSGSATNRGGTFDASLGKNARLENSTGLDGEARVLSVAQTLAPQTTGLRPDEAIDNASPVRARLAADTLEQAGFDRVTLTSRDAIQLEDGLALGAGRALPLRDVTLDAARIETTGGDAAITADTVRLGNLDAYRVGSDDSYTDTGVLKVDARLLELSGNLRLRGMERAELTGTEAVQLSGTVLSTAPARPSARIETTADLTLGGAVIAPASYSQVSLLAPGKTVRFTRTTDTPIQPLTALGSLTVEAKAIEQAGNMWAPFGQVTLKADDTLDLASGSLTSVAAAPGSLTPFGKLQNGRDWVVDIAPDTVPDGQIKQDGLAEKSIQLKAASIDMQAGAIVDLAGGGELQAYEFTVGPGGSQDILSDSKTYAILPAYKSGFAPADAQESFNRASGEAVYLSGVPGLADGVYTLLPAHYALLPGAYAVKLDSDIAGVMPEQAYSRQDGVRIAAGYVTDSRVLSGQAGVPKDANWQGVQVLTRDQVRARSEFTLTQASAFFAGSRNRPQDAGRLAVVSSGSGIDALKLDASYRLAASAGGRGAQVDLEARNIVVTSGAQGGIDPAAVVFDADTLNALGAGSILIGGTRTTSADTTTLAVGAESVTLANDAAHVLVASEILLAASDTLTLKAGSALNAQGAAGDAGAYATAGNGALVRAASTTASFSRTGSPDRSQGSLTGEAGSTIVAADSVTLDATRVNAYQGTATFAKNGVAVAGNLGVGATRVNFGAALAAAEGITYDQAELDALHLKSLALTSYSTFDLYGDVRVGQLDATGKPLLQTLSLQGAGLAGIDNAGKTARLNAQAIALANPAGVAFVSGATPGSGALAVTADTLALGAGSKAIQGFGAVSVTANELVATTGTGSLDIDAPATFKVARISGEQNANQSLVAAGVLAVAQHPADRALVPVSALGARWDMQGSAIDFNSRAELPSGSIKLTAGSGNINLGENARVDVAGSSVQFFDVAKPSWGGAAEFVSTAGAVAFARGANVDVSAAAGGDAGSLIVRAAQGEVSLADGSVSGAAPVDAAGERGEGAHVLIDSGALTSFSPLNQALNSGGFDGARDLRVRSGDLSIAAADRVAAHDVTIVVDGGTLEVAGVLDVSGTKAGRIALFAGDDVNVLATAQLKAVSGSANEDGGDIEIGTRDGSLDLAAGSVLAVAGGTSGQGGSVLLRAPRTASDVKIDALDSTISGARSVAVEAVKVYDNKTTLTATGASSGTSLSLATIQTDNKAYAGNSVAIKTRLGKSADPAFHLLSGVEVRSSGDLTLGTGAATTDWNLSTARAGGEPGVLTLRAAGNLAIKSNLSDGFSHATVFKSGTTPADLLAGASWSYRLIAGADSAAADPLAVKAVAKDVSLAAGKLIRTGTGDIRVVSGRDIKLADTKAVIYTAGRASDPLPGFTNPLSNAGAKFSEGGGDVSLTAQGDVVGTASTQLFNDWLFRQGRVNSATGEFDKANPQTAWWVRFDQFQQGVGALGGGDVTVSAGGDVKNLSAHAPTQARMASSVPDGAALKTSGGGSVRIEAGHDILGGQYYADRGTVVLKSGGSVSSGQNVFSKPIYTILALGDAQARVQAQDDVNIQSVLNPHWIVQSSGSVNTQYNISPSTASRKTLFSTYTADSSVSLASLNDTVTLHNANGSSTVGNLKTAYKNLLDTEEGKRQGQLDLLTYLPPTLEATAFQGDILIHDQPAGGVLTMVPAARGNLDLLARDSVRLNATIRMSDRDPASLLGAAVSGLTAPSVTLPSASQLHAANPVHAADTLPARIYALNEDVEGISLAYAGRDKSTRVDLPKAFAVRAGRDVRDFSIQAQHAANGDHSLVQAGRDVRFTSDSQRTNNDQIWVGGSGLLEVVAGRNIDLGTSAGIVSRGNLDNASLPAAGVDIQLTAGVGPNGVDYQGAVDRLLASLAAGTPDDATLWQARWLTGDTQLTAANARAAVQAVDAQGAEQQQASVRSMLFSALRETGRDSNMKDSPYAGDYARGYAAIERVFPGISEKNPDGSFKNYQGGINLFASRVKTEGGGNIEWLAPGGNMVVGLANTPRALVDVGSDVLGVVAAGAGDIKGFTRGDVLVNQSRILTVAGGDVLLWSSDGDIDAGKGKKTATAVPPPVIVAKADGSFEQKLQGAATGSGIGALSTGSGTAGDVDLVAPKGTVNAGDAGIRAGNLNIAAAVVLGADNISVSGTATGTPVADTSAVTAASSGATSADGGTAAATAAMSSNLADAARAAEELKQAFKPTFISAEVVGHGE